MSPASTTDAVEAAGANNSPLPSAPVSDASASAPAASSELEQRPRRPKKSDEQKKAADAEKAKVRRRLKDLSEARTVEELEQKLLQKIRPEPAPTPGEPSPAAAPSLTLIQGGAQPAAVTRPVWPDEKNVAPFRQPLLQILTAANLVAAAKLPGTPWPLSDGEVKQLADASAPVVAKYVPDFFATPEAQLAAVAAAIFVPRILAVLMAEAGSSSAETQPAGKVAA